MVTAHGACMGTLGLMECQKYALYVVRKRWVSRFRCTAWKKSNLEKNREKWVISWIGISASWVVGCYRWKESTRHSFFGWSFRWSGCETTSSAFVYFYARALIVYEYSSSGQAISTAQHGGKGTVLDSSQKNLRTMKSIRLAFFAAFLQ